MSDNEATTQVFRSTSDEVIASKSPYVQSIEEMSDLLLRNPVKCLKAFDKHGPLGLFFLFFTKSMIRNIILWTNFHLTFKKELLVNKEKNKQNILR